MVLKDNPRGNWLFPQYIPINLQILHNMKLCFLDLRFIYLSLKELSSRITSLLIVLSFLYIWAKDSQFTPILSLL